MTLLLQACPASKIKICVLFNSQHSIKAFPPNCACSFGMRRRKRTENVVVMQIVVASSGQALLSASQAQILTVSESDYASVAALSFPFLLHQKEA